MTIRRTTLAAVAAGALALTACGNDDQDNGFEPADPANASQAAADAENDSKPHALSDTVTVGNTLTISDMEIDTTGCEFTFPEDIKRDAVKFDVLATVDNQTGEDVAEALWGSDFTFLDADGLTVKTTDIASAEGSCLNDNAHQFVDMKSGEKRRAAVTLEAPAGATTMTYSASTISGAEPVTWDIADAVADMVVTSPGEEGPGDGPAPTPAAEAPEPAAAPAAADNGFESGGTYNGPVVPNPDIPGANRPYPGEPGFEDDQSILDSGLSNAELANMGIDVSSPNDCDGYLGAHEDPDDSHC